MDEKFCLGWIFQGPTLSACRTGGNISRVGPDDEYNSKLCDFYMVQVFNWSVSIQPVSQGEGEWMNVAYNMDCMEAMRQMPDKCFDLAVVDPPYGIGESGEKNKTRGGLVQAKAYKPFVGKDLDAPPKEYFLELTRVSKDQIIFGANHFADRLPRAASSCWIVWDKENGSTDFADCELAWTSFRSAVRIFRFRWQGMLQGDMANKEVRIHPTQKPVKLYAWIFSHYAKPGYKILDTHLGSGSSRIAAYDAGLDFVGFEIDPHYFKAQEDRYAAHIAQTSLFV